MLKGIFGNKTAGRVLLHIYHYGEIHASAIATDYKVALNPIRQQLVRFEEAGILVSKQIGRSRLYQLNPKSPYKKSIQEILHISYETMPLADRRKLFSARRRPRRKDKPIL